MVRARRFHWNPGAYEMVGISNCAARTADLTAHILMPASFWLQVLRAPCDAHLTVPRGTRSSDGREVEGTGGPCCCAPSRAPRHALPCFVNPRCSHSARRNTRPLAIHRGGVRVPRLHAGRRPLHSRGKAHPCSIRAKCLAARNVRDAVGMAPVQVYSPGAEWHPRRGGARLGREAAFTTAPS